MAVLERRKISRMKKESFYLAEHAEDITSQAGEDGVIHKIFEIMPPRNKYCVEFGAWNGVYLSNSWALITGSQWQALLIEGDAEKYPELEANYRDNPNVTTLNSFVDFDANSLDKILARAEAPADLDMISIDIDGNEWHIWQMMEAFRPRLMVIEFNPTIPNDIFFVQDRDLAINHGCSLLALIELGREKGYELVSALSYNAFFVPVEEFPTFDIADNSIDAMYDASDYQIKLFQGYDGSLINAGYDRLIWKNVPINHEDLQVLPQSMRQYFEPAADTRDGSTPIWRTSE